MDNFDQFSLLFVSFVRKKNLFDLFLWMQFNWLKAAEPLLRDSLLFTTKSAGVNRDYLNDLERIKG